MKRLKTVLNVVIIATMAFGFAAFMGDPAHAGTDTYTNLVPTGEEDEAALNAKKVNFNGRTWFIIADESTDEDTGTVTLFAADTSFGTAHYAQVGGTYAQSEIRASLKEMTDSGAFKDVAKAIVETDNGKLYLLSSGEARSLPDNVLYLMFTGGSTGQDGYWWLRDHYNSTFDYVWAVKSYGERPTFDWWKYDKIYGVRPALQLDLRKVAFDTTSKTFSLAYSVKLSGGANATTSGGEKTQKDLTGDMETVTFTADAGYHFDGFEDITSNGVTATRTSATVVTVSGTPTDGVDITIPDAYTFGDPTYTWAEDHSTVTAKRVCKNDATHIEEETVNATPEQTKDPTCTEKGETTYTSETFKNTAFEQQTETVANIDALGHKYGPWEKADDQYHQRACERDTLHVEKATHTWDAGKVTKEATTTSEGEKLYTCTLCKATKTESIPKVKPAPKPTPAKAKSTARTVLMANGIANGKRGVNFAWSNVKADRYAIYLGQCDYKGKTYAMKRVKIVNGKTFKWKKSGFKKNTAYKFYVVAQKKSGSSYKNVAKSNMGHFFTGNVRGKYTNPKSLKLSGSALVIKKGRSATIKGSVAKVKKNKALATSHAPMLRYMSNDPTVAAVNASGKVTAKKAGTAVIYVQTINGIWKTCKVTVK